MLVILVILNCLSYKVPWWKFWNGIQSERIIAILKFVSKPFRIIQNQFAKLFNHSESIQMNSNCFFQSESIRMNPRSKWFWLKTWFVFIRIEFFFETFARACLQIINSRSIYYSPENSHRFNSIWYFANFHNLLPNVV